MILGMTRLWRGTPWLLIVIGILSVFTGLRDIYAPRFLSYSHTSNAEKSGLAPLLLVTGVIWLVAGIGAFRKLRLNPEGKEEPVVRTISGPQ